ncbi:MAG: pectate lyase [Bacteroidaceae bacterium]|nr:pectate lyase [Bacteroidaceae bacterium]
MKKRMLIAAWLLMQCWLGISAALTLKETGGWFESGYVTWELMEGASSYRVYYRIQDGEYKQLDGSLVRNYGTYGRADVIGIKPGTYQFKIVALDEQENPLAESETESPLFTVCPHDRGGFAHFRYQGIGAYNDDGTLKSGAKVLYVTAATAKTVTCDVVTKSNGTAQTFTGLQNIIGAYQKGYDKTPLAIRIIGTIEAEDMDKFGSSAQGLQIKGKNAEAEMNITIEGVGNDAAIRGFGILVRNSKSVELRNFAIMLCMDDCISVDSDNSHCWIHNIDFFYGQTGGDADQAKGDGSLDCKGDSKYMTFSYNRFWDCGKMALCGMTSESGENFITYHHNWFDHSDSRHPRVRTMTVHVYNNYFDGVSKYGVGATMGSNVFVESNYFRNTDKPMLISLQGSDIAGGKGTFSGENGGMIKAYGNVYAEKSANFKLVTHKESATGFDCYEADSRNEQVPSTYVTLAGKTTYNNFDTDETKMYAYTPHDANLVPEVVTGEYGAGRMQHGDFTWTFNNAVDDDDYEVNTAMKTAITAYTPTLVSIFGGEDLGSGDDENGDNTGNDNETGDNDTPTTPELPADGNYVCHFTGQNPSNSFYTISGNCSGSKGKATVNGVTYTDCLKIESSTSIRFTITTKMTLTLVFAEGSVPNIKVDGEKLTVQNSHIITCQLEAGTHEIKKAGSYNLFYINLTPDASQIVPIQSTQQNAPYYDLSGRRVENPSRGIYIRAGKKVVVD